MKDHRLASIYMVADKRGLILFQGSWHLFIICLFRWGLVYLKLVSNSLFGLVQGWPWTSGVVTAHHWAGLCSAWNRTTGSCIVGNLSLTVVDFCVYLAGNIWALEEINELTGHGTSGWRLPGKKKTKIWRYNNSWVGISDHVSPDALPMDIPALSGTMKGTRALQIQHITQAFYPGAMIDILTCPCLTRFYILADNSVYVSKLMKDTM